MGIKARLLESLESRVDRTTRKGNFLPEASSRAQQVSLEGLSEPPSLGIPGSPWPALPAGSWLALLVFPPTLISDGPSFLYLLIGRYGENFGSQRVTVP